jgi:hypothetical protein
VLWHSSQSSVSNPGARMFQGVGSVELIRSIHGISSDLVKELDG